MPTSRGSSVAIEALPAWAQLKPEFLVTNIEKRLEDMVETVSKYSERSQHSNFIGRKYASWRINRSIDSFNRAQGLASEICMERALTGHTVRSEIVDQLIDLNVEYAPMLKKVGRQE